MFPAVVFLSEKLCLKEELEADLLVRRGDRRAIADLAKLRSTLDDQNARLQRAVDTLQGSRCDATLSCFGCVT
jgi:hypothetical protein